MSRKKNEVSTSNTSQQISRRSQIVFYGLSMLTSFFNFLYYPLMSRLVPVNIYGEIQFLVTLLYQLSVLFLALNIITVIFSITYSRDHSVLARKISALSSLLNVSTLIVTCLLITTLSIFHEAFQFDNVLAVVCLGLAILSTVPFTVGVGKLQGQFHFATAGLMNATGAALKLVSSTALVLSGFGTAGAILGIAIGQIIAVLLFSYRGHLAPSELFSFKTSVIRRLSADRTLLLVSICTVIVNIIMTADTIGAKLLLPPQEAGEYAGIATLAKIAIFVVSPLMWLIIPGAVRYSSDNKSVNTQVTLAVGFCILLLLTYVMGGTILIPLIVGEQYLVMKDILIFSTVAASALTIAATLNVILIARQLYRQAIRQTALILLMFVTLLAIRPFVDMLPSILLAQSISGGLGILYYLIVSTTSYEK